MEAFVCFLLISIFANDCMTEVMSLQINQTTQFFDHGTSQEYCQFEIFQPKCLRNEVIVIQKAFYGRMKVGRCLADDPAVIGMGKDDPRNVGCFEDVQKLLDSKCSGKSDCEIRIPDPEIQKNSPCYRTLAMYLDASYACAAVVQQDRSCKLFATDIPIHLSSFFQSELSCGRRSQPWIMEAQPGQRIKVSMIDFNGIVRHGSDDASAEVHNFRSCRSSYGYIEDRDVNENVSICGDRKERETVLYTSKGNEIRLILTQEIEQYYNFLIQFQGIGCSDLVPPPDAWLKRNGNEAIVGCYSTRQTWHLHCKKYQWIGVMGNCTQQLMAEQTWQKPSSSHSHDNNNDSQTLILTVVSSGFVLFCLIIGCICVTLIRRFRPKQSKEVESRPTSMRYSNVRINNDLLIVGLGNETIGTYDPAVVEIRNHP